MSGQPVLRIEEGVEVRKVRLCDLFPSAQLKASHRDYKHQCVYQLLDPTTSRFGKRLHDALSQLFNQTTRRHRRLAIEDDEFFHADKVQRVEQARKYSRDGTRLYQPYPCRKKPLSTLLKPSILQSDKRFTLQLCSSTAGASVAAPSITNTFPGSIPVSLMEADIPKLYDGAYFFVWAPKTNGLRFFAVGCHFGHEPWLLLVNRSQQVIAIPNTTAPDVLFDGTVLDGELVPTHDGKFAYIAYDCAMSCGVPCGEYSYLVRLQIASLLLESWNKCKNTNINDYNSMSEEALNEWKTLNPASTSSTASLEKDGDGCVLDWRVKRVFSTERFHEMLTLELPSLDHDVDGFMSTAVEPPIQIGQTQTIFKIKRATDHTIDFLAVVLNAATVKDSQPLLVDLVAMHNKGLSQVEAGVLWDTVQIPIYQLPVLRRRFGVSDTVSKNPEVWLNGKVVECRYNPALCTWDLELVRSDKNAPNKLSTAEKTWKNIQENLSLLQIFPEGSMTRNQRQLLKEWEQNHPNWKPNPNETNIVAKHNLTAITTAPAPLAKLITFN